MKYNAKSAEVLNEADRFERILDWQLFCAEQDARLFGPVADGEWVPGDSMYKHPHRRNNLFFRSPDPLPDPEWDEWEGPNGNCPRPMYQIYNEFNYTINGWEYYECRECEVGWSSHVDECWMCGEPRYRPAEGNFKEKLLEQALFYGSSGEAIGRIMSTQRDELGFTINVELNDAAFVTGIRERFERMTADMLETSARFSRMYHAIPRQFARYTLLDVEATQGLYDGIHGVRADRIFVDELHPPTHQSRRSEEPPCPGTGHRILSESPFEPDQVVGPIWGAAAFWDPLQASELPPVPLWGWPVIPRIDEIDMTVNWPIPEFEQQEFPDYHDAYWERFNQPNRRRN